jgi:uncharacterized damage-inducible protein DinB
MPTNHLPAERTPTRALHSVSPDVPTDLLIAHAEYVQWATDRTLRMLDCLPADALTRPVISSFPTILDTLRHLYRWDRYYLEHLKGGHVQLEQITLPDAYGELRQAWGELHKELLDWARIHLSERKNVVLHGWATWPTWMVVMQLANHASHHLGQVLTLVRQAGYMPQQSDWTDLILFYLDRFNVPGDLPTAP